MTDAATLVLVHGAWSGSWMWWKLAPFLDVRGVAHHEVDLPTCSASDTSVDVHDDVAHVREVVESLDGPVVLVGNSYGGAVITGVLSTNVARLVYLAAFMPAENEALFPLMSQSATPDFGSAVEMLSDGRMHLDSDVEIRCALQQATADDHDIVRTKTSHAMSFGTDFDVAFGRVAWRDTPSTYVVCLDDRSIRPELQVSWAKERATDTVEVPFDHCPQVSHPAEIGDLLAAIARDATS